MSNDSNQGNDFYHQLKHVNEFLQRPEDFNSPIAQNVEEYERHSSQSQDIHQEIDVFVRPSDIFKEAKANLREKGHI
ncbi:MULTISPECIES: hypothetical protein [Staphylococcus]|uniref:hypothetical protein n=1 Tax=Staphylococcus TaxID=1279 RepID=UPI0008A462F3|nr:MULTISPECIES: hypothetical protein [Staphylococcus]ARB78019.1 hypothetical protein A6J61_06800 [Staphylococcus lugdunensis]ARJ19139.1 hypothetical protein B7467_09055 [Staphylococcus lugdunensis]ARJ27636.1 hypothetical protein B7469_08030 [Staphylococcus lugdunensis]MBM7133290.1 hypothetical protein [Staphylococcus lugdunensis]MCH8641684.1 hypothetical protein [Staphylococcus lugdunensis]